MAVISMCINEDLNESLGELVARIAETKRATIAETLMIIYNAYHEFGLHFGEDNGNSRVEWEPAYIVPMSKPCGARCLQ